jgi:hypothetical protein
MQAETRQVPIVHHPGGIETGENVSQLPGVFLIGSLPIVVVVTAASEPAAATLSFSTMR